MSALIKSAFLTVLICITFQVVAENQTGLVNNPNVEPTPLPFGPYLDFCVNLPPGFGGVPNSGNLKALNAQGDEGLFVARDPYLSLDDCLTFFAPVLDIDPLPNE